MNTQFCQFFYLLVFSGALLGASSSDQRSEERKLFTKTSSINFVTRWTFQGLCDHVCDLRKKHGIPFDPQAVQPGDTIFVRNIDVFMRKIHPLISHPYIILTHGFMNETNYEYQRRYLEEDTIIAWFSIHPMRDGYKKYYPLPLGISGKKSVYKQSKEYINGLLTELQDTAPKSHLVYLNFKVTTAPERSLIRQLFSGEPFVLERKRNIKFTKYLEEMASCKFVFSPRGSGPDSFRTWEALLVGTIPIVRRGAYGLNVPLDEIDVGDSVLDDLYDNLPVLVVDNWEDITEEFLNQKYAEITSRTYDISTLYIEYWREKIAKIRDDFLKSYVGQS